MTQLYFDQNESHEILRTAPVAGQAAFAAALTDLLKAYEGKTMSESYHATTARLERLVEMAQVIFHGVFIPPASPVVLSVTRETNAHDHSNISVGAQFYHLPGWVPTADNWENSNSSSINVEEHGHPMISVVLQLMLIGPNLGIGTKEIIIPSKPPRFFQNGSTVFRVVLEDIIGRMNKYASLLQGAAVKVDDDTFNAFIPAGDDLYFSIVVEIDK